MRLSLASVVHWADSREVREWFMQRVAFPTSDVLAFLVVNQLAYRGALRPTDLASTLGTGRANVTKIVARLEPLGLVTRVPSPVDERSVLVALTAAGREMGARILAVAEDHFRTAVEGWPDDEIETLRRVMARFSRTAMAAIAERSPMLGAHQNGLEARPTPAPPLPSGTGPPPAAPR